ncbi:MAG: hypothetical protein ABI718_00425 [Acidobacteriota bacterium]
MRRLFTLTVILCCAAFSLSAEEKEQTLSSPDGKTQVSVPASWVVMDLNKAAEIQAGHEGQGCFLIVLNETKEDLYGWNIEKHSRVTLASLLSKLAFPTITGPKSLKINGNPAVQYEVKGATDNINIIYLHTTVDGKSFFSQILGWSVPSQAERCRPELNRAIASFRETS